MHTTCLTHDLFQDETADYLLEVDDEPPDFQEEVDTPDGKPNPEW
jgi:hypothetical protein